jgi:succinate dehydrogenase / fumarate reductase flavoprotein subunit
MNPVWRRKLLVCSTEDGSSVTVEQKTQPSMADHLIQLFDRDELTKYLTDEEMTEFDGIAKS